MHWEYVVVTVLFILCMYVQMLYRVIYNVCQQMFSGTFVDENSKPLKLTQDQQQTISELRALAHFMSWFGLSAIALNVAFTFAIGSEIPLWFKMLTAMVNSGIILSVFKLSKDALQVNSYVQK